MRVLTPFEFIHKYPESPSMVIVGNGPSLKDNGLGSWIDSHDIVVRFNSCPVSGYRADVGSKTTILVTNPYPEGRESLSSLGVGCPTIFVINPQTRRGDLSEFKEWVGDNDVLFTYNPDIVGVKNNINHQAGFTTGTYATQLLPRILAPSRVSIVGFTMFLGKSNFHYFSSRCPKGLKAHDVKREAKIFIHVCNHIKCPVEVGEDIAWVAKKSFVRLRRSIIVRKLKVNQWKK